MRSADAKRTSSDLDYDFVTTLDREDGHEAHGVRMDWRIGPLFVASYALEFYPTATAWRVRAEADGARLDVVDGAGADEDMRADGALAAAAADAVIPAAPGARGRKRRPAER